MPAEAPSRGRLGVALWLAPLLVALAAGFHCWLHVPTGEMEPRTAEPPTRAPKAAAPLRSENQRRP
jgi:hypothetical protein